MRAFRISRFREKDRTFDGEGARTYPGRWNPLGIPVVYTSASIALATLEILVHAERRHFAVPHYLLSVDVPDSMIERLDPSMLPRDWRDRRHRSATQVLGGTWATTLRSVALLVPSAIVPDEANVILNPRHPDFPTLHIGPSMLFPLDLRLLSIPDAT